VNENGIIRIRKKDTEGIESKVKITGIIRNTKFLCYMS
jgi:hypothetical protein